MNTRSTTLSKEYRKRFQDEERYRNAVWKILCSQFFSKYIPPASTLLDLGAGWGEFTRNVVANEKYAMDLNPDCGDLVAGYATFLQQDCSSTWPLLDESLDVVFTSNFLEHLPSKECIDQTLTEAYRCLKPSGILICLGPNIKYVLGAYWDYWDHYIPITDRSLSEALILCGFTIHSKIDRFLPYTMSSGKTPPLALIRVYLKLRLLWPYFGKQFLIVAKKPA